MNNSVRKRSCLIPKWETKKNPEATAGHSDKKKRREARRSKAIGKRHWMPTKLTSLSSSSSSSSSSTYFFSFFTTKRLRLLFFSRGPDRSSAKDDTFRCGRSTAVVNLLEKRITTKRRSRERENMFQKKKRKRGEAVRFHWEMRSSSVPTGHQQSPFFFRRCSSFHRFLDSN